MKRAACVLLPLLLCACEPAPLPDPSIVSVRPDRVAAGRPSSLSVQVNAVLPLTVDYQDRTVDPALLAMTVRLAGQEVDIPFVEPDGTLVVPVPEGLPEGTYDVQLTLADGRQAVRERAFSVVPAPSLNGPNPGHPDEPGSRITGFLVDHIQEQGRNTPFQITVRAEGPDANLFQDRVSVRASKGIVTQLTPASFAGGVLVEELSLSHPGSVYLLVEDTRGHMGLSNSFLVRAN